MSGKSFLVLALLLLSLAASLSEPVTADVEDNHVEEGPSYLFVTGIAGLLAVIEVITISYVARVKKMSLEMPLMVFLMSGFLTIAMTGFMIIFHEALLGAFEIVPIDFAAHLLRDGLIGFDIAVPIALIAFPLSQKITSLVAGKPEEN